MNSFLETGVEHRDPQVSNLMAGAPPRGHEQIQEFEPKPKEANKSRLEKRWCEEIEHSWVKMYGLTRKARTSRSFRFAE